MYSLDSSTASSNIRNEICQGFGGGGGRVDRNPLGSEDASRYYAISSPLLLNFYLDSFTISCIDLKVYMSFDGLKKLV